MTFFRERLYWISPSGLKTLQQMPVSSTVSRRAQSSGASPGESSPLGTDQGARLVGDAAVLAVRGDGEAGYGECVAGEHPYYSAETTETAWHVITEFIAPRLVGRGDQFPLGHRWQPPAVRARSEAETSASWNAETPSAASFCAA